MKTTPSHDSFSKQSPSLKLAVIGTRMLLCLLGATMAHSSLARSATASLSVPSAGEQRFARASDENERRVRENSFSTLPIQLRPLTDLRDLPRAEIPFHRPTTRLVSVFTPDQFERLYETIVAQKQIIFKDIKEDGHLGGCFARAEEIARVMELNGMMVSKLFIFPAASKSGFMHTRDPETGEVIDWGYHVVPAVLVNIRGKLEIYVIDPALSKTPLSLTKTLSSVLWSDAAGGKFEITAADRSAYIPDSLKEPNPFHRVDANAVADSFNVLEVQRRREAMKH